MKSLPHTVPQLLQKILDRLETELGVDLISTVMCLLVCARNGKEHALRRPREHFLKKKVISPKVLLSIQKTMIITFTKAIGNISGVQTREIHICLNQTQNYPRSSCALLSAQTHQVCLKAATSQE